MSYQNELRAIALGGMLAMAACGDSALAPPSMPLSEPVGPPAHSRLVFARCAEVHWVSDWDYTSCTAGGLVVREPDGSEKDLFGRPFVGFFFDDDPAWSPDGQSIAFTGYRHCAPEAMQCSSEIYLAKADGTGVTRLTHSPSSQNSQPAWSPDGRKIVYVAFVNDDQRLTGPMLRVVDIGGSGAASLGNLGGSHPAWSPDGKRIAFSRGPAGESGIFVADADGSNPTRLTGEQGVGDSEPAWSPDGRTLAFTRMSRSLCQVWLMGADGSNPRALTQEPGCASAPAWAPDGKLAFNTRGGILVINADGKGLRYLRLGNMWAPTPPSRVSWAPLP